MGSMLNAWFFRGREITHFVTATTHIHANKESEGQTDPPTQGKAAIKQLAL